MKKQTKFLFGIVVAFVVTISTIVALSFYLTSSIVDTANYFFSAVKQKEITKARNYLAGDFKASTDEKALIEFLSKSAILNFKESSWSKRQVSGDRSELHGSITTDTGGVVPIKMIFVKENDSWNIYAIQKPSAGLQSEDSSPTAPNKANQVSLVKQSMHDFIISVGKKDMEHFRSTVSHLWQQQHTTKTLNKAFEEIINSGGNWEVLEDLTPVLSSDAQIDENEVLLLAGYYTTEPNQVHFEQKYVYEGLSWKLIGFMIEAK